MSEKKSVTVTIYKNEYTLKGDADPQQIIDLAHYVDTRMTEMGQKSSAPADKIAILVAMNIADELHRLEKLNEDNLELIENLEKNFQETKSAADTTIKNASEQNEEIHKIRIQISQEKEKFQSIELQKIQLEKWNEELKRQVEILTSEVEKIKQNFSENQNTFHEFQLALENQKKLTSDAEAKVENLKNQCAILESQLSEAKETLENVRQSPTSSSVSNNNVSVPDERISRLVTKINSVLGLIN